MCKKVWSWSAQGEEPGAVVAKIFTQVNALAKWPEAAIFYVCGVSPTCRQVVLELGDGASRPRTPHRLSRHEPRDARSSAPRRADALVVAQASLWWSPWLWLRQPSVCTGQSLESRAAAWSLAVCRYRVEATLAGATVHNWLGDPHDTQGHLARDAV